MEEQGDIAAEHWEAHGSQKNHLELDFLNEVNMNNRSQKRD